MKERITYKRVTRLTEVNSKCYFAAILNLRRHQLLLHGDMNRNELKCVKWLNEQIDCNGIMANL